MRFLITWTGMFAGRVGVPSLLTKDEVKKIRTVVDAPTWMDAKAYAATVSSDSVTVQAVDIDPPTTVELQWTGDDANHGGSPQGRRRQVRKFEKGVWGAWTNL